MLGDGSIQARSNKPNSKANARYSITIKETSRNYIEFLRETVFNSFKPCPLIPYPNSMLKQHNNKKVIQYHFNTTSMPFFTELHSIWYVWNKDKNKYQKIIPLAIKDIFTSESLVHWIIQDGYFDGHGRTITVILCTESFTKKECIILQELLLNYNIKSSLKVRNKEINTYRIRLSKTSISILKSLVLPSMPLDFQYKLGIITNLKYLGPSLNFTICWDTLKLRLHIYLIFMF